MIDLKSGPIEVKLLTAGANWMRVGSMLGLGLTGYFSKLPKGSTASAHTMHPGEACFFGPERVDDGTYHMAITTPPWLARTAAEGRGFSKRPLRLRSMCTFPHFDHLALAVRTDLGITSIHQLREQKVPLNISTAPIHLGHPTGWVLDVLLEEYGMKIEDFESWGGSVIFGDRQPNFMEKVPDGRIDRVSAMKSGVLNAVFDEALMSRPWMEVADAVDLTFLPVDRDVLDRLEQKYGVRPGVIPKGSLRGVTHDVPTVDFSGWLLYCSQNLPDELVYLTMQGLEQQRAQIESMFPSKHLGLTGPIDLATMHQNVELPLHPGAEQFYRERGYV